jgi:hypothetical protein
VTGPEHYQRAEELIIQNRRAADEDDTTRIRRLTAAQIHATLALAAATALGTSATETRAWTDVAGSRLSQG